MRNPSNLPADLYPPCPFKLKNVPLENGDGQKLLQCTTCAGCGEMADVERKTTGTVGQQVTETGRMPAAKAQRIQKQGWTIAKSTCPDCGGAGMKIAAR